MCNPIRLQFSQSGFHQSMKYHAISNVSFPVQQKTLMGTVGVIAMRGTDFTIRVKLVNVNQDIFFSTTFAQSVHRIRTVLEEEQEIYCAGEIHRQKSGLKELISATVLMDLQRNRSSRCV